jgi:hypothetical protein
MNSELDVKAISNERLAELVEAYATPGTPYAGTMSMSDEDDNWGSVARTN